VIPRRLETLRTPPAPKLTKVKKTLKPRRSSRNGILKVAVARPAVESVPAKFVKTCGVLKDARKSASGFRGIQSVPDEIPGRIESEAAP
jgi:hypothetical protein